MQRVTLADPGGGGRQGQKPPAPVQTGAAIQISPPPQKKENDKWKSRKAPGKQEMKEKQGDLNNFMT